ncbi:hypothetical protein AMS68_005394 [Peltaster fructicola]|uniref:Ribosome biogenesis regulatory protein n=1 Tax=Peltaster fructicola TaxID=286661 RepID=A0A6H0XYQ2_9PEZI|nr:hypothetical protein AMS68_005394 [Peltaster fructicola]
MAHLTQRPQPYTFDLGLLLCNDSNAIPPLGDDKEAALSEIARETAQALINQLLTTCTVATPSQQLLQFTLPPPVTHLPREKPVPKEREKTTWERFAAKKGITKKRKDGKLVFDESTGAWKPKYGYKGKPSESTKGIQEDWLVEA